MIEPKKQMVDAIETYFTQLIVLIHIKCILAIQRKCL